MKAKVVRPGKNSPAGISQTVDEIIVVVGGRTYVIAEGEDGVDLDIRSWSGAPAIHLSAANVVRVAPRDK